MSKLTRRLVLAGTAAALGVGLYFGRGVLWRWYSTGKLEWPKTVEEVLAIHTPRVEAKYRPILEANGLAWPHDQISLLAFKDERIVEVWADGAKKLQLESFTIQGMSGGLGPKRKEGDLQVPEGLYALTNLNPQSLFHLSVRVDYPNEEDKAVLGSDPGSDIYVHGGSASVGCLAMGDEVIEEIFVLAALAKTRRILISPVDLRTRELPSSLATEEDWLKGRYERLGAELSRFRE